mmetsp:Transcript_13623/g.24620  ORF Transcript_13623/g.24620 Transcript_13623/m.24620 type:complete len:256 (+) Transcript_13623:1005-1772(+)
MVSEETKNAVPAQAPSLVASVFYPQPLPCFIVPVTRLQEPVIFALISIHEAVLAADVHVIDDMVCEIVSHFNEFGVIECVNDLVRRLLIRVLLVEDREIWEHSGRKCVDFAQVALEGVPHSVREPRAILPKVWRDATSNDSACIEASIWSNKILMCRQCDVAAHYPHSQTCHAAKGVAGSEFHNDAIHIIDSQSQVELLVELDCVRVAHSTLASIQVWNDTGESVHLQKASNAKDVGRHAPQVVQKNDCWQIFVS